MEGAVIIVAIILFGLVVGYVKYQFKIGRW